MAIKKNTPDLHEDVKLPYGKKNYILFGVAILVIIFGFISLSQGSETLAPILLVFGYLVLIPVALMVKDDSTSNQSNNNEISD